MRHDFEGLNYVLLNVHNLAQKFSLRIGGNRSANNRHRNLVVDKWYFLMLSISTDIATKLSTAGHEVKVTNTEEPQELTITAKKLGAMPATIYEVVKGVDVIFVSIPTKAIFEFPEDLIKNSPDNVIIVDTTNYYPFRDGEIEELDNGKVESVWVAEQLGRPVIKAFNNLLAHTLATTGKSEGENGRIAMAVSGDDKDAKKIMSNLTNDTGFSAVDNGNISESWRHQPGTPAYCTELNRKELKQALDDGVKEDAARLRDLAIKKLQKRTSQPSHEEIVVLNRSLFPKNPKKL